MKILMVLYLLTGNDSWGVVRVPVTLNPNESCHDVVERNLTYEVSLTKFYMHKDPLSLIIVPL
jgi:hypothetical protein